MFLLDYLNAFFSPCWVPHLSRYNKVLKCWAATSCVPYNFSEEIYKKVSHDKKKGETTEGKNIFKGLTYNKKSGFLLSFLAISLVLKFLLVVRVAIVVAMEWLGTTLFSALLELQQTIHGACIIHQQMMMFSNTVLQQKAMKNMHNSISRMIWVSGLGLAGICMISFLVKNTMKQFLITRA